MTHTSSIKCKKKLSFTEFLFRLIIIYLRPKQKHNPMKKQIIFFVVFISMYAAVVAQVGVNTDGSIPNSSAMLDVKSSTKGFLPPRMTLAERSAVSSPADGLVVYCSDCGTGGLGALCMYMAGAWYTLDASCSNPLTPVAGVHTVSPTQVVWNWNTVLNATGYKWNTINDYASATDIGANTTKTETGLTCASSYTRYAWAYNGCGNSAPVSLTQTTGACWTCGGPFTISHAAGSIAPVSKTVTYGTVNNIPGATSKCWITSNLGADHQATAVDDTTEASAGWYWQFNRKQGFKHTGTTRTPNTIWINSINENSDWLPANDPCALLLGSGWRLPTSTEWTNVDANGGWTNWNGPWNSGLKLHGAGYIFFSIGSLEFRGVIGYAWSSSQTNSLGGSDLFFYSSDCGVEPDAKTTGSSVRCLKD
jgi:hypothetical protein